jgi:hypothetical protein
MSARNTKIAITTVNSARRRVPRPFQMPETPLAQATAAFAARTYPRFLLQHCQRSFELAVLIGAVEEVRVDLEVLYVGALLHDVGLTRRFHSAETRCEVASADVARSFARERGMSPSRAEIVWDVVALHGTSSIATHKSAEASLAARAIGADVTGLGLDPFPQDVIEKIMTSRPGFAQPFIEAVVADLEDKPEVAHGTWMAAIADAHIADFHPVSVEELAFENPFERAQ